MAEIVTIPVSRLKYFKPIAVSKAPNAQVQKMAEDIREHGIRKPLIVRPVGDLYEVVCGLVRWKGALVAGIEEVPAKVRQLTDAEALALAMSDNLTPVDDLSFDAPALRDFESFAGFLETADESALSDPLEKTPFVLDEPLCTGLCQLFAKDFNAEWAAAECKGAFPKTEVDEFDRDLASFHNGLAQGRLQLAGVNGQDLHEILLIFVEAYLDTSEPERPFKCHKGFWESFSRDEQEEIRSDAARLSPLISAIVYR